MRKIFIVAKREYLATVVSKGFLIGLFLMPLMMCGGMVIPHLLRNRVDLTDKRVIVMDGTKSLFADLHQAAEARNTIVTARQSSQTEAVKAEPRYVLENGPEEVTDEVRLSLSDQVRRREIYGFLEISPSLRLNAEIDPSSAGPGAVGSRVAFYGENIALSDVSRWLEVTTQRIVQVKRFQSAGLAPETTSRAITPIPFEPMGLVSATADGTIKKAEKSDRLVAIFLPAGVMMLMFMVVWMAAQPALESVLEEKQQKIAEVLLGCVTPSQLMGGKLIGGLAGSLTLVGIYTGGACLVAHRYGVLDQLPLRILPWFILFQILAVLFYSSLFMAVAASANSLKDAQGLLVPVWMLFVMPLMMWFNVVREPNGPVAFWVSLFPPATSLMMVIRLASSNAVPIWQPILGAVLVIITTGVFVFAAGRIFRIGYLTQGQTPSFRVLFRWAIRG